MITDKKEKEVLDELEQLYLSLGETGENYTLTDKYEDLNQYVSSLRQEVLDADLYAEDIGEKSDYYIVLADLLSNIKLVILKYAPEYFDED